MGWNGSTRARHMAFQTTDSDNLEQYCMDINLFLPSDVGFWSYFYLQNPTPRALSAANQI